MLVKFSGHNFSSFLLCPGGPLRLRGKEGERVREEPPGAGSVAPGGGRPAAGGYSPRRQAQAVQEGDGETRGHGDGWLLGRNHLCMPYFTPGHVKRLAPGRGDGDGGGSPPAALHARLPPGCQAAAVAAAGRGGGEATFPAPLTPSGQQAPGPAAPASAPLCPASLFPPGAASAPSGRPARRGEARRGVRPVAASPGREEPGRAAGGGGSRPRAP